MMEKKDKITKKFLLAVILASIVNLLALGLWVFFKVSPLVPLINNLKEEITTKEIKDIYFSYDELIWDINRVTKKYDVVFLIEDVYGRKLNNTRIQTDFNLVTDMVKVGDEYYLLKVYSNKGIGVYKLVMQLVLFQIIIMVLVLMLFFEYTRNNIIKPIYKLTSDIRNYKFGNKPVRRNVETEFDLINNEFVSLTDKLEIEKEEQNRIIASISHDIKTPLTSIIGYSELIKEGKLSKDTRKYVEKITDKAWHIKELLVAFDDYLVNQEKLSLNLEVIKIKEIVKNLYDDYLVELNSKKISFEVKTRLKDEEILVDIVKLKRIFSNIISNSSRYLDSNGKIVVEIVKDNEWYKFLIKDNGPGVDEEILDKIFNPLFTTDKSRKVSGLGLSIVKTFVEMHEGEIRAYNDKGLGIEIKLPVREDK